MEETPQQFDDKKVAKQRCDVQLVLCWVRCIVVILFVVWQLFFLFVVNTEVGKEVLDDSVYRYGRMTGTDQRWAMFSSPLWRKNEFIFGEIEFGDGSREMIQTDSEPGDHTRFFRMGGARLRKLEELVGKSNNSRYYTDLRKRYGRYLAQLWRDGHVDDVRVPVKVRIMKRRFWIAKPGDERPAAPKPIALSQEDALIMIVELDVKTDDADVPTQDGPGVDCE